MTMDRGSGAQEEMLQDLGTWLMPPIFLVFFGLAVPCGAVAVASLGWQLGIMAGFDIGAAVFLVSALMMLKRRA